MNKKLKEMIGVVQDVASKVSIHPTEVSRMDISMYYPDITEWEYRRFGGLDKIKQAFPITDKELGSIKATKDLKSYITKLEQKVGEKQHLEQELLKAINKTIKPVKINSYKRKSKKSKKTRDIVAMINDTHFGLNVDPEEVGGVNKFNWTVASRRTAFFIDEVCKYKEDKRDQVGTLHFLINGDIIAGIIHGLQGRDLELLTHQMNGAVHILTNAIARLAEAYPNIKVYFSTGNHEDMPHRRESHRVINQIYDSFGSIVFYSVSSAHKNTKNVKFICNKTLYQDIDLPSGRAIMTHGHIMFSKQLGNPGSSINTKALSDVIMRFNNGEREKGNKPVKLVLVGHTHSHMHITTNDGVQVYNAPSLSGVDSYAFSLGINHNLTAQVMFESTDKYIFGDSRLLHVTEADNNPEYDKIIPPYKNKLTWE